MQKLLKKTKGFCPKCRRIVGAEVFEENQDVFIRKNCPEDGDLVTTYFWPKLNLYQVMSSIYEKRQKGYPIAKLIYLNHDCNQSCNFCFAQSNERQNLMPSIEDILNEVKDFKGQYIYLCGGEPTLREDLFMIIKFLKKLKFKVVLMTNGKRLTDHKYIKRLENTGLDIIQLQFDTFDDQQYKILRGEELVKIKLQVVESLKETRIRLQLWVMLVKGINDNQIDRIIKYAAQNSEIIKVVFFISAWSLGRHKIQEPLTKSEILKILEKKSGIRENDFISYTVFDHYISEIYNLFINRRLNRSSICNVDCYLFTMKKSIVPLPRLIDLEKINRFLKHLYETSVKEPKVKKWKVALKILHFFLFKQNLFRRNLVPFVFRTMLSFSQAFMNKQYPHNRYGPLFHIRVGSFVDVDSSDLDLFQHCNIFSSNKNRFASFCLNEILKDSAAKEYSRK